MRLCLFLMLAVKFASAQGVIETYAGTDWTFGPNSQRALDAPLGEFTAMAGDTKGNLYFATENRLFRVDRGGLLERIAGNGLSGYSGDGGDARNASVGAIHSIAADAEGNVFVLSSGSFRIRVIRANLTIEAFAGTGERRPDTVLSLPPQPALEATFSTLLSIAVDSAGNLYIAEPLLVRKISTDGMIRTFAGGGQVPPNEGVPALDATLRPPVNNFSGNYAPLLVDRQDRVIMFAGYRVMAVGADGIMRWIAGTGTVGPAQAGRRARESNLLIAGFAPGADGTIYLSQSQSGVQILAITPDGFIRSVAGNLSSTSTGDGGPATQAGIGQAPAFLALSGTGDLNLIDRLCYCVRRIDGAGIINRVAGNGLLLQSPDGSSKADSYFLFPLGLSFDKDLNLLVASRGFIVSNQTAGRIDRISREGAYSNLGGGFQFSGTTAKTAQFNALYGIVGDSSGRPVFVTEPPTVRRIEADGRLTTIGPVLRGSQLRGLIYDAEQNLIVASSNSRRIHRLSPDGVTSDIAGDGRNASSGDGGPATAASFRQPYALAYNPAGDLFVTDIADHRVRKIDRTGIITTICGTGQPGSTGDGEPAANATLNEPSGIAVDSRGRIYILERAGNRIRMIDERGIIQTIAGTGEAGYSGDGELSTRARISGPDLGIVLAPNGDLYFSDTNNQRIRVIRSQLPAVSIVTVEVPARVAQGEVLKFSLNRLQPATSVLVTAAARTTSGNWLSVSPAIAPTPVELQVTIDAATLTPGSYTGQVEVSYRGAGATSTVLAAYNIRLTVVPPNPGRLRVPTQSLSVSLDAGGRDQQSISIVNDGGLGVAVSVSATVEGSTRWLTAAPAAATIAPGQTLPLDIQISAAGLAAGAFSGAVVIEGGGQPVRVPVVLVVKQSIRPSLVVSQAGLTFVAVAKGGVPSPQTVGILNEGTGEMNWQAKASILGGGNWLAISADSGRVARPLVDISSLSIGVNHQNLERGDYYGQVEVTTPGGSPHLIMVLLRVLAEGSQPPPEVRPTGLIFIGTPTVHPGSQAVTVTNLRAAPISFFSYRGTEDGRQWFRQLPATGAVQPNSPVQIAVQPEFTGLEPGILRGGMSLQFGDVIQNVNVLSIVAPSGTAFDAKGLTERALGGCASKNIQIQFTSLPEGFQAAVGEPLTVEVRMVDDCGTPLTPQTAPDVKPIAYIANRGQITLSHIGGGLWSGTLKPTAASDTQVELNVVVNVANNLSLAGRLGTIRTLSRTPLVQSGSLRHSASFATDVPVAPGQLISILGGNLADRETKVDMPPFPPSLDTTEVLLGGRPLPLLFTSDGQINAQIPYDLPSDTLHQVVVRRGGTLSVPERFVVAQAQPGIFTVNEQGFGQGFILRADGKTADAANPARRGDAVVILCTGLGAVTPLLAPGAPSPTAPPNVVGQVQSSIGGRPAEVLSATLDPGSAGRYRVRVVVPPDAPIGREVPVLLIAAGRSSQQVTMAVE